MSIIVAMTESNTNNYNYIRISYKNRVPLSIIYIFRL